MIVTKKVKVRMCDIEKENLLAIIRGGAGISNEAIFAYVNELMAKAIDVALEERENEY